MPGPEGAAAPDTREKLAKAAEAETRPTMPRETVDAIWPRLGRVDEDPEVRAYLEGRNMDPARIANLDLARAIPAGGGDPEWARIKGYTWSAAGFRLALRLFNVDGIPSAIHARCVRPEGPPGDCPKGATPQGFTIKGLTMANTLARAHLLEHDEDEPRTERGLPAPSWLAPGELFEVVVAEGATDFLTWCLSLDAQGKTAAVLGIVSGSMQSTWANLLPKGRARLVIATDHDEAGEKYAETARATLGRNAARITRWGQA